MTKINKVNLEEFTNIKSNIYDILCIAANFYEKLLNANNLTFLRRYDSFIKMVNVARYVFLDSAIIDYFNGNLKVSMEKQGVFFYIEDKLFDCNTVEEIKTFIYEKLKREFNTKKTLLEAEISLSNKELEELCKEEIKMVE